MPSPPSLAEVRAKFGEPGRYQAGSLDRLSGLTEPAADDIGYMRGWYARIHGEIHHEGAVYLEVKPELDRTLAVWNDWLEAHGRPRERALPL